MLGFHSPRPNISTTSFPRGRVRRDTNIIFEKLHDLLPPNHHQRRKPKKTLTSKHLAHSQAAHPKAGPIMFSAQSPSSPDDRSRTSRASTIFFSAASKMRFSPRSPRRRAPSSSDDSVIPRSTKSFRFPSAVDDKTRPLHRVGQPPALTELPPVFIPNGDGLIAGFTLRTDSRSSLEKARWGKWADWRFKMRRMPGRVGRRMRSVGRKVRRGIKSKFRGQ